jgi:hypothetical protein
MPQNGTQLVHCQTIERHPGGRADERPGPKLRVEREQSEPPLTAFKARIQEIYATIRGVAPKTIIEGERKPA